MINFQKELLLFKGCINFLSFYVCKGWIKLVLCPSVVDMVIGSNIVSVHRSSIKVLWCFLYAVLSWETDVDPIVFEHQRRGGFVLKRL